MLPKKYKKSLAGLDISLTLHKKQLLLLLGFCGCLLVLCGKIAYQLGVNQGKKTAWLVTDHKGHVVSADDIKILRLNYDLLKNEVLTLTQERDIGVNSLSLLQDKMQQLQEQNNQLSALNETLGKKLAQNEPVQLLEADIRALEDNIFEYHFTVLVAGDKAKQLIPKLMLIGQTSMANIPLNPSQITGSGLMRVYGKFIMPKGFHPKQLRVTMMVDGHSVTRIYNWKAVH